MHHEQNDPGTDCILAIDMHVYGFLPLAVPAEPVRSHTLDQVYRCPLLQWGGRALVLATSEP